MIPDDYDPRRETAREVAHGLLVALFFAVSVPAISLIIIFIGRITP